jgi:long-chain acyl-CoA synthetase
VNHLYEILESAALKSPDRPALHFQNHTLTYHDLKYASDRLASGLKGIGLGVGDRVAILLPNVPHFVFSYFALLKIGVTVIPISIMDKAAEIHHQLDDAEVRGIIYWQGVREYVRQAINGLDQCNKLIVLGEKSGESEVQLTALMETHAPYDHLDHVDPDDTAFVFYTAGITGRPKGAELSHHNILSNVEACQSFFKFTQDDSIVAELPLSLPVGLTLILSTFMYAGASIYLMPKFDAASILPFIAEKKPTYFIGMPSLYHALVSLELKEIPRLNNIKFWLSIGDALKPEIFEAFEARFTGIILEGYGLTEAGPVVSFNSPTRERKPGSIGLPLPGIDLKILDQDGEEVRTGQVGEICIQGPGIMKGYLNKPEATKTALADGWLHTGDLACLDESGFPIIVARKKNVIMKSGFSVYPREVEKFLSAYPKIQEAVVVGLPDSTVGEEIHASVVLKPGEEATQEEIITYCREMMAAYKAPKTVHFGLSLPKGPSGRVLREEVKQILMDKQRYR